MYVPKPFAIRQVIQINFFLLLFGLLDLFFCLYIGCVDILCLLRSGEVCCGSLLYGGRERRRRVRRAFGRRKERGRGGQSLSEPPRAVLLCWLAYLMSVKEITRERKEKEERKRRK